MRLLWKMGGSRLKVVFRHHNGMERGAGCDLKACMITKLLQSQHRESNDVSASDLFHFLESNFV